MRQLLVTLFTFAVRERTYAQPDAVGYRGWLALPLIGVVAFRRLDGSLLWEW